MFDVDAFLARPLPARVAANRSWRWRPRSRHYLCEEPEVEWLGIRPRSLRAKDFSYSTG
ncbi:hypothetical protein HFP15_35010 [Amycolatopsis sp. K13G38]|uniref:Uncharacterized protein n=1 Tax=Amycolatopsis acididurans TaxID=2724524 RepID=A0ABX1JE69_9PSEU|nr:hypothetical protein [Amycolatopsis acididurans]NKQ58082.1 hypothetical protein [Amycolatopsis acididurans]